MGVVANWTIIADWTTVGPCCNLSWLTIIFIITVIVTLVLTIYEQQDAWRTYKAIQYDESNEMEILASSTLFRSGARILIQLSFLILASTGVWISTRENPGDIYWYRIVFVVSFLLAEFLLCFMTINDIVARRRLGRYLTDHNKE